MKNIKLLYLICTLFIANTLFAEEQPMTIKWNGTSIITNSLENKPKDATSIKEITLGEGSGTVTTYSNFDYEKQTATVVKIIPFSHSKIMAVGDAIKADNPNLATSNEKNLPSFIKYNSDRDFQIELPSSFLEQKFAPPPEEQMKRLKKNGKKLVSDIEFKMSKMNEVYKKHKEKYGEMKVYAECKDDNCIVKVTTTVSISTSKPVPKDSDNPNKPNNP